MHPKPEFKSVHVGISGQFDPRAVAPDSLARCGLPARHARNVDVLHDSPGFAWFAAGPCEVQVLPGHFDVEYRQPPYRPLRDLILATLDGMSDPQTSGVHIDRRLDFPFRRRREVDRILGMLAANGWISGFGGDRLCTVEFQPGKPQGGCQWIFVDRSRLLAESGRPGIRIEVSDRWLGGPDSTESTKLISTILRHGFEDSVRDADAIIGGVATVWH